VWEEKQLCNFRCLWAILFFGVISGQFQAACAQKVSPSAIRLKLLQAKNEKIHQKFQTSLEQLESESKQAGLSQLALKIQRLQDPDLVSDLRSVSLPKKILPPIPADSPAEEKLIRNRLRILRKEHAIDLYVLARNSLNSGFPSFAYSLVRETAFHDSDHRMARRLLGYVKDKDQWVTPIVKEMLLNRKVWHDQFGWILKSRVKNYEAGQRYVNGRWMSIEKEAEIRKDFRRAWEVRTDHFLIKTNHSLAMGVEIGKALEDYYQVFFQTFATFFNSPQQMKSLFQSAGRSRSRSIKQKPHEVHYFATKEEYVKKLINKIPQIEITNGLYYTSDRVSYFFHDPNANNEITLFHEATHQLFFESDPKHRSIAEKENFWIIEGIACYMESFRRNGKGPVLGDPNYQRFQAGRYRYLNDKYYIPLRKFSAMGMNDFQNQPNIAKNYSQASGLTRFFMHYDGGSYRDALIEHLSLIYRSAGNRVVIVKSLSTLTDTSITELDTQYGEFLRATQDQLNEQKAAAAR